MNWLAEHAHPISGYAWIIWFAWWMLMAFRNKQTKQRESRTQRLEHMIPLVFAYLLLFQPGFGGAVLAQPLLPLSPQLQITGLVLVIAGLLFAVWARVFLGKNWSGTVTIKADHELIRRGPYRWIRHPIYTGMLAALAGVWFTQGLRSGLLGCALAFLALYRKASREEKFLSAEFGEKFAEHTRHTGMFLPRFT